jgi:hypothetical protein
MSAGFELEAIGKEALSVIGFLEMVPQLNALKRNAFFTHGKYILLPRHRNELRSLPTTRPRAGRNVAATQSRGRKGWRAVYAMGRRRAVVVGAKATTGGGAMQEKEIMTQPRTETAVLIDAVEAVIGVSGGELHKLLVVVADRLAEQEATINALRAELVELSAKAMSGEDTIRHLRVEICNASAILMTQLETIKTIQAEIDLLNRRPKR